MPYGAEHKSLDCCERSDKVQPKLEEKEKGSQLTPPRLRESKTNLRAMHPKPYSNLIFSRSPSNEFQTRKRFEKGFINSEASRLPAIEGMSIVSRPHAISVAVPKKRNEKIDSQQLCFGSSRTSLSRMVKPSFFSFSCLNLFSLVVSCKRLHLLRHRFDMMSHRDRWRDARPNLSQLTHEVVSKGFHQSSGEKQKKFLNWC